MSIPTYEDCMLPLLELLSDGQERSISQVEEALAERFGLSPAERAQLLPSGQQSVFKNRIGWARTYMRKAGLVDAPRRGVLKIADRGVQTLAAKPAKIDARYLERWPEFVAFASPAPVEKPGALDLASPSVSTPEESIEAAFQKLRRDLADELLARLLTCSPTFFERLVVELLVKIGYGGSRKDAGEHLGRSGDGGIDGVIKEDRLGLSAIYIQAKRWQNTVGSPQVQQFAGALLRQPGATKGVFITTAAFSADAIAYAKAITPKVVLIDGQRLADLMIDHDVGVAAAVTYTVKRIDLDFFEEG
jgi:restriction system protein